MRLSVASRRTVVSASEYVSVLDCLGSLMDDLIPEPTHDDLASFRFAALVGDLMLSYTALEHELTCVIYAVVTRFSNKRRDVLLTVLGGQRMAPLKDTIKRLMRATRANKKRIAYLDAVFKQLGEIQYFRDRIAHHITVLTDDPDVFTNMNFAAIREMEKMEDITFNISTLAAASDDLRVIRLCCEGLFSHYLGKGPSAVPAEPTWQYKPSMLIRDRPISSGSRERPPRPRITHRD